MGSFVRLSEDFLKGANSADSTNKYSLFALLLSADQRHPGLVLALRIKDMVRMVASIVGRIFVLDYFEAVIPALDYLSVELLL